MIRRRIIEIKSNSDEYDRLEVWSNKQDICICLDHDHNENSAVTFDREDLKELISALQNVLKEGDE